MPAHAAESRVQAEPCELCRLPAGEGLIIIQRCPRHTERTISSKRRADFSQENNLDRARPFPIISLRTFLPDNTFFIADARPGISCGSMSMQASPATSGIDDVVDDMTGHPHCMASSTGSPNPSYRDGNINTSAPV